MEISNWVYCLFDIASRELISDTAGLGSIIRWSLSIIQRWHFRGTTDKYSHKKIQGHRRIKQSMSWQIITWYSWDLLRNRLIRNALGEMISWMTSFYQQSIYTYMYSLKQIDYGHNGKCCDYRELFSCPWTTLRRFWKTKVSGVCAWLDFCPRPMFQIARPPPNIMQSLHYVYLAISSSPESLCSGWANIFVPVIPHQIRQLLSHILPTKLQ